MRTHHRRGHTYNTARRYRKLFAVQTEDTFSGQENVHFLVLLMFVFEWHSFACYQ